MDFSFTYITKRFYSKKFYGKSFQEEKASNLKNLESQDLDLYYSICQLQRGQNSLPKNDLNQKTKINQKNNFNNISLKKKVWKVCIPKIGLDAEIKEGTSSTVINRSVGHFESTNLWDGNVGLAAHNSGKKSNYFERLKELSNKDIIYYETEYGTRAYEIVVNSIILETDWSFLKQTSDNRVTLVTCVKNMPNYRRCIQAIEIK